MWRMVGGVEEDDAGDITVLYSERGFTREGYLIF